MDSREPVTIDLTKHLDDETAAFLHEFLSEDESEENENKIKVFHPNTEYSHNGIKFRLSHLLLRQTETTLNSTQAIKDTFTGKKTYYYAVCDYDEKNEDKNKIGSGGFGGVYHALFALRHKENKMELGTFEKPQALKVVRFELAEYEDLPHSRIKQEQEKEKEKLRYANTIAVERAKDLGAKKMTIEKKGNLRTKSYMLADLLSGKDLNKLIEEWKENPPTISERFQLSILLLEALQTQISNQQIVHRDIKPGNIKVDTHTTPWTVKIFDVGESAIIGSNRELAGTSPVWLAPEATESMSIMNSAASDTYSMGRAIRFLWGDKQVLEDQELAKQNHGDAKLIFKKYLAAQKSERHEFTISSELHDSCIAQRISKDAIKQFQNLITDITLPNWKQRKPLDAAITGLKAIDFTPEPLDKLLLNNQNPLTLKQRYDITLALIKKLKEIHGQGKIHGNIHPANIVMYINKNPIEVSILDKPHVKERKDTPEYLPPEIAYNPKYENKTSDVYALGLVLRELWMDQERQSELTLFNSFNTNKDQEIINFQKAKYDTPNNIGTRGINVAVILPQDVIAALTSNNISSDNLIKVLEQTTISHRSNRLALDRIELDNQLAITPKWLERNRGAVTGGLKGAATMSGVSTVLAGVAVATGIVLTGPVGIVAAIAAPVIAVVGGAAVGAAVGKKDKQSNDSKPDSTKGQEADSDKEEYDAEKKSDHTPKAPGM